MMLVRGYNLLEYLSDAFTKLRMVRQSCASRPGWNPGGFSVEWRTKARSDASRSPSRE